MFKTPFWIFYFDCISTFSYILGKPHFTPERFLNQGDLAQDELWGHEFKAAVRKTRKSYQNCSLFFLHCFIDKWTLGLVFLIPYQLWMHIYILLLSSKRYSFQLKNCWLRDLTSAKVALLPNFVFFRLDSISIFLFYIFYT